MQMQLISHNSMSAGAQGASHDADAFVAQNPPPLDTQQTLPTETYHHQINHHQIDGHGNSESTNQLPSIRHVLGQAELESPFLPDRNYPIGGNGPFETHTSQPYPNTPYQGTFQASSGPSDDSYAVQHPSYESTHFNSTNQSQSYSGGHENASAGLATNLLLLPRPENRYIPLNVSPPVSQSEVAFPDSSTADANFWTAFETQNPPHSGTLGTPSPSSSPSAATNYSQHLSPAGPVDNHEAWEYSVQKFILGYKDSMWVNHPRDYKVSWDQHCKEVVARARRHNVDFEEQYRVVDRFTSTRMDSHFTSQPPKYVRDALWTVLSPMLSSRQDPIVPWDWALQRIQYETNLGMIVSACKQIMGGDYYWAFVSLCSNFFVSPADVEFDKKRAEVREQLMKLDADNYEYHARITQDEQKTLTEQNRNPKGGRAQKRRKRGCDDNGYDSDEL